VRIALTIAGSDSGGGAGIQADLKTFQRFGVFGTSVITAITAQNTVGVQAWRGVDVDLVRAQIDALASDLPPAAVKSGMLGDMTIAQVVARAIRDHTFPNYVLDPVMSASSGDALLAAGGVDVIHAQLVPLATLVTPNLPEAELLTGEPVSDVPSMERAARILVAKSGARAAIVTGGHLTGDRVVDVLFDGEITRYEHPRLQTTSVHGTGCTLSAAITAQLALGVALREAVRLAIEYVQHAIATAPGLGQGHGPLNHSA
jgi:hydroxymethylpyrimidine/phosphomethylpyrimidine kinase